MRWLAVTFVACCFLLAIVNAEGTSVKTNHLSRSGTKQTKLPVRPTKTRISMSIRPVWSESARLAQLVAKDKLFLHADNEDSDRPRWMPVLIWALAGRTGQCFCFIALWLIWRFEVYMYIYCLQIVRRSLIPSVALFVSAHNPDWLDVDKKCICFNTYCCWPAPVWNDIC